MGELETHIEKLPISADAKAELARSSLQLKLERERVEYNVERQLASLEHAMAKPQSRHFRDISSWQEQLLEQEGGSLLDINFGDHRFVGLQRRELADLLEAFSVVDDAGEKVTVEKIQELTKNPGVQSLDFNSAVEGTKFVIPIESVSARIITPQLDFGLDKTQPTAEQTRQLEEIKNVLIDNESDRFSQDVAQIAKTANKEVLVNGGVVTAELRQYSDLSLAGQQQDFMDDINCLYWWNPDQISFQSISDNLEKLKAQPAGSKSIEKMFLEKSDEGQALVVETYMPGVQLVVKSQTPGQELNLTSARLELRIVGSDLAERGQKRPFLKSETCKGFLSGLEEVGLTPSEVVESPIKEGALELWGHKEFSDRYGNGFADLAREVIKHIGQSRNEVARELFGEREVTPDQAEQLRRLAMLEKSGGAKLLLNMVADIFDPQSPQRGEIVAPTFVSGRSLRDGGCKDVESYFISSSEQEADFISKKAGAHTYLNKKPLLVDGVRIPPGFVMRRNENGAVELMRPTMFALSEVDARDAFGDQYIDFQGSQKRYSSNSIRHSFLNE